MAGFSIKHKGSFKHTENFLAAMLKQRELQNILERYGQQGVLALAANTPKDSGITADSWGFKARASNGRYSIQWYNTEMAGSTPVVILLQYGHGTGTGGYVRGYDFINPAIRPVFDQMSDAIWEAVKSA